MSIQERGIGVKGRETFAEFNQKHELDLRLARRGKTGDLALQ